MTSETRIPFNANDTVRVRLTDLGRAIHRKDHDAFISSLSPGVVRANFPYRAPEEDSDGWSRWHLWEFMKTFGPHCYLGCTMPFEPGIELVLGRST